MTEGGYWITENEHELTRFELDNRAMNLPDLKGPLLCTQ
ncbi:hypothetical protein PRUB_a3396 [Pseudoalteromonas rubra]|uniref:Uncharacterized protein n=1 Tax=Pseudoalteromonas rubra TaxID=43658 RepID=A0A8T0C2T0_9GAMM|nr:hypothetical protein PRUB_a3396 [Pseudoalteromonas rubra]